MASGLTCREVMVLWYILMWVRGFEVPSNLVKSGILKPSGKVALGNGVRFLASRGADGNAPGVGKGADENVWQALGQGVEMMMRLCIDFGYWMRLELNDRWEDESKSCQSAGDQEAA
ncbi:hypothetical protein Dimus_035837 [Dionaea muscipula]